MSTRDGPTRWAAILGCSLLATPLVGLFVAAETPAAGAPTTAVTSARPAPDDRAMRAPHVAVTTTAPATTTTATTTTTTVASTTTTAPPAPPSTTVAAPAPAPVASPAASPEERADAAYLATVPAAWRSAIAVEIAVIGGATSWSYPSGRIEVSASHASRGPGVLATTIAHEFGHLIAWRYGSQASYGAAPAGWPAYSSHLQEAWADCVAFVFTGSPEPSHGLPACPAASLEWTRSWLNAGPAAHPRTG